MLPLMSPEQLAFQGASILQSLALWMEQEQRREGNTQKEVEPIYQNTGLYLFYNKLKKIK